MDKFQFYMEKEKLEDTIKEYKEVMKSYNLRIQAIPRLYSNNLEMMENALKFYDEKLDLIKKNIGKPYFARIDFKRDGEKKIEKIYIGKVGIMNEDNEIITVDWRAPISSMYYDSNIGKASYKAPEGICTGELQVKRQFEIENGVLNSYQDVDTVSNDELLKPYLATSVDNRLKNIVSTIQTEQNEIIRENLNKNLIIQGVAGSGKTTVALHRIAYLVYNNRDILSPDQYMVIGPNKFFVDYISSVLPDLDVDNVVQSTFFELCENCINEKLELINEEKNLIKSITNSKDLKYERLKVSMQFKEALDKFIQDFDSNVILNSDFFVKGYKVIPAKLFEREYFGLENTSIYDSIKKKIDKTELIVEKFIENYRDKILDKVKIQFEHKSRNLNIEEYAKEKKNIQSVEKEISKNCSSLLKKYLSKKIPKITTLYIEFLQNINDYMDVSKIENISEKMKNNIANIKKGKVEFEDLSALIYLRTKILGKDDFKKYKQVAIDEAQDYGEFCFYALKELLKDASFSIYGDLAQSIYQYRGINEWNEVLDKTFQNNCDIKYLLKSYRTTTEIMNEANKITKFININHAEPVIRHGEKVEYINFEDEKNQINIIENIIKDYKEKGYNSIAIICKNDKEANEINDKLAQDNFTAKNVINSETKYEGGICTITSYLAKGLEFDGVIVANASEDKYSSDEVIDMKLLYVSMTRPLHELKVLYNGNIVEPLKKEIL